MKPMDVEMLCRWAFGAEALKNPYAPPPMVNGYDQLLYQAELLTLKVRDGSGGVWPFMDEKLGGPHPDALVVRAAARSLGLMAIDCYQNAEGLLGQAAPLLLAEEAELIARHEAWAVGAEIVGAPTPYRNGGRPPRVELDGGGRRARLLDERRDGPILTVTRDVYDLIACHAALGTRPDWTPAEFRCRPVLAGNNKVLVVGGLDRSRKRYREGAHSNLRWQPGPAEIAVERAIYLIWHAGLCELAAALDGRLAGHAALSPSAPSQPWLGEDEALRERRILADVGNSAGGEIGA